MKNKGFTLIEILIYSGIVTTILSFTLVIVYQLIDSDERVVERREITENHKFILEKIGWVLQSVDKINSPAVGATSTKLSVNKLGYAFNPLVIQIGTSTLDLVSGATTSPITNNYASTTSLVFEHQNLASTSAIRITATIENTTASSTIDATFIIK